MEEHSNIKQDRKLGFGDWNVVTSHEPLCWNKLKTFGIPTGQLDVKPNTDHDVKLRGK